MQEMRGLRDGGPRVRREESRMRGSPQRHRGHRETTGGSFDLAESTARSRDPVPSRQVEGTCQGVLGARGVALENPGGLSFSSSPKFEGGSAKGLLRNNEEHIATRLANNVFSCLTLQNVESICLA